MCYIIIGAIQVLCVGGIFVTLRIKRNIDKRVLSAKHSYINQTLHFFLLFCAKVFIHITASILSYAVAVITSNDNFNSYKSISKNLLFAQTDKIVVATLFAVCFIEVLVCSLLATIFCSDTSMRKTTIWSANTWYAQVMEIFLSAAVQVAFVFDNSVCHLWLRYLAKYFKLLCDILELDHAIYLTDLVHKEHALLDGSCWIPIHFFRILRSITYTYFISKQAIYLVGHRSHKAWWLFSLSDLVPSVCSPCSLYKIINCVAESYCSTQKGRWSLRVFAKAHWVDKSQR